jgi:hypothetical protein
MDGGTPPRTPWSRTVIYELHAKGMTALHPLVPPEPAARFSDWPRSLSCGISSASASRRSSSCRSTSRRRARARAARPHELLGLQHARISRPVSGSRRQRRRSTWRASSR